MSRTECRILRVSSGTSRMPIARVRISQDDAQVFVATTCASQEALLNEEAQRGCAGRRPRGDLESSAASCSVPSSR